MSFEWQEPAWQTPLDQADEVELLSLPRQSIVTEVGWPGGFWNQVGERHRLVAAEAERVIQLFRGLEVSEPARCHFAPWGLAFYRRDVLLFTVTLCYQCSNAYVYTSQCKDLRGFGPNGPSAAGLRELLRKHLRRNEGGAIPRLPG